MTFIEYLTEHLNKKHWWFILFDENNNKIKNGVFYSREPTLSKACKSMRLSRLLLAKKILAINIFKIKTNELEVRSLTNLDKAQDFYKSKGYKDPYDFQVVRVMNDGNYKWLYSWQSKMLSDKVKIQKVSK